MKVYVVSVMAGFLVGAIYALLGVRSPAPPVVALLGLLGMLLGEQGLTVSKRLIRGEPLSRAWFADECIPKITGAVRPRPPVSSAVVVASNAPSPSDEK